MTRILFYTNVANRHDFLGRFLLAKVYRQKKTALVYCENERLQTLDDDLWTMGEEDFLPHALYDPAEAVPAAAPVLLADAPPADAFYADFLISLHVEQPDFVGRFPVYVDVVGSDSQEKQQGRDRFSYFQTHGYPIEHFPMSSPDTPL